LVEHPAQGAQLKVIASEDCGYVADTIAQNSGIDYRDKAKLLCQMNPIRRMENTLKLLQHMLTLK
jgi:hypothetical protein